MSKYSDNPDLEFKDISSEKFRTYVYPPTRVGEPNNEFRIERPAVISYKAPVQAWTAGGSHRVIDKDGRAYYVPSGWIGIYWDKSPGDKPYNW